MFIEAKMLGDKLVIILNNDAWLKSKKGFVFMPEEERKEIIEAIGVVDKVILTEHVQNDSDRSVSRELQKIRPHIFANGGDRHPDDHAVPEVRVCEELNIKMIYNVGHGGKVQSSSWLTKNVKKHLPTKISKNKLRASGKKL